MIPLQDTGRTTYVADFNASDEDDDIEGGQHWSPPETDSEEDEWQPQPDSDDDESDENQEDPEVSGNCFQDAVTIIANATWTVDSFEEAKEVSQEEASGSQEASENRDRV